MGQGRRYRSSSSKMRKPRLNRDGALELAVRYSYINLNDQDEDNNGEQTDYTLGVNWYINDEIKLMLNYIVAEPLGTKLYNGRLHVLQTRILFSF
ncbi:MAG: porin [Sulfurimonas sp.]|nr:porin [Sulfurimonas sp.]